MRDSCAHTIFLVRRRRAAEHPAELVFRSILDTRPSNLHEFVEVVFQNTKNELQSWHLDGYDFWVVR